MQEQVICFDISIISKLNMKSRGISQNLLGALQPWVHFLHGGDGTPLVPLLILIHLTTSSLDKKAYKPSSLQTKCINAKGVISNLGYSGADSTDSDRLGCWPE